MIKSAKFWAIIAFLVVTSLQFFIVKGFVDEVFDAQEEYVAVIKKLDPKTKAPLTDTIRVIEEAKDAEDDFMKEYRQAQADWLNAYLMILAVLLALVGVVVPIICAEKGRELNDITKKAEETAEKAEETVKMLKNFDYEKMENRLKTFENNFETAQNALNAAQSDLDKKIEKAKDEISKETKAFSFVLDGMKEKNPQKAAKSFKRAIEYYEKILGKNPDNANTLYSIGVAYSFLNQHEKAVEYYEKALEKNPDEADTLYNIGFAYENLNQQEKAIEYYGRALEKNPDYADALYNIGVAYGNLNQHEKAIEYYGRALEKNPDYTDALYNIGVAYHNLNQYERAIEYYRRAFEKNPDETDALSNIVAIYDYLNQRQKALDAVKEFKAKNPTIDKEKKKLLLEDFGKLRDSAEKTEILKIIQEMEEEG